MERSRILLLVFLAVIGSVVLSPVAASAAGCGLRCFGNGEGISAGVGPSDVDLRGSTEAGGSETGDPVPSGAGGIVDAQHPSGNDTGSDRDPQQITDSLGTCRSDRCRDTGTPSITLTDLASFSPTTPTIHMEPHGWALRGRPANAIAETTTNTHDGTLLGHPITVRFTPTAYRWDWGDGTRDAFTTPGSTWEELDLPRFSETDTSHTYTQRGTVAVTLSIDYTVDYSTDTGTDSAGWIPVTGTVAATTSTSTYVGTAQTVNVPDDCNARPDDPGC